MATIALLIYLLAKGISIKGIILTMIGWLLLDVIGNVLMYTSKGELKEKKHYVFLCMVGAIVFFGIYFVKNPLAIFNQIGFEKMFEDAFLYVMLNFLIALGFIFQVYVVISFFIQKKEVSD